MKELIISYDKKDFRIDTFCAGGNGGQNQNKRQTGVRITHLPSGLVGESREHRSQHQNKMTAWRRLGKLVKEWAIKKFGYVMPAEQSTEVVRTYNVVDNRVKDHASGEQLTWDEVSNYIGGMIDARREAKTEDGE